jgi:ADP-ribose pyrophosphatase YjhB (NUDIX family)
MVQKLINQLEDKINEPTKGLIDEVFYFVGRLTPFINVDLLVKNDLGQTLLSWRDETMYKNRVGAGWHIPGGIVRLRETISERIRQVALNEMGGKLIYHSSEPLSVNQIIDHKAKDRSHFISLLYECKLQESYKVNNKDLKFGEVGFLKWHSCVPVNLLRNHLIYKDFINLKNC